MFLILRNMESLDMRVQLKRVLKLSLLEVLDGQKFSGRWMLQLAKFL